MFILKMLNLDWLINRLDPYQYLSMIFRYLPSQDLSKKPESIDKFLPWSNLMQEMCKN